MNRYICWLALLAVAAVPDWASAFNRRYRCGPLYPAYYEPLYFAPAVYTPPVVYAPPPCVPVYVSAPECAPTPAPATSPTPKTAMRAPKPMPPTAEPVVPAGGIVPSPAASKIDVPKVDIPKWDVPKSPGLELPSAVPSAAPSLSLPPPPPPVAPDAGSPLIPSMVPPLSPEPKKADTLPPLVLPPETPPRTSRSSPVGEVTVQVFTASGAGAAAEGLKKVVFFNHTARDLDLTIDGRGVKLPAKTYVNARLGASFVWKQGDAEAETATIPADAAGLDVVFKE